MEEGDFWFQRHNLAKIHAGHLFTISDEYLRRGLPPPFASVLAQKARSINKEIGFEMSRKVPRCYQCALNFTVENSFTMEIKKKKKVKCLTVFSDHPYMPVLRFKRNGYTCLIINCSGCGAKMIGGKLKGFSSYGQKSFSCDSLVQFDSIPATSTPLNIKTRLNSISMDTPRLVYHRSEERSKQSSAKRRQGVSRLQRLLNNQSVLQNSSASSSLHDFLNIFKL
ncbi:unnamed protein product [Dracunculus medinensis]|uniref:Zf-3CxxC domain-containing protein n=1 Tax=Dracunculus medinensis TaxID=318479 RepID=A0A0N4UIM0_DRAME|nr:unnamed protein product [Dracunculus medinensis]